MRTGTIATEKQQIARVETESDTYRPANVDYAARDEDVRLMLRFRDGDEKAFDELVSRHKQRIFGVLQRLMNDRDDIEDLSQEVFIRVFKSRASYRPTARFSTWLYRIATNLAINAARSRRRLRFFTGLGEESSTLNAKPDEKAPSPDQRAQGQELAAEVRRAINTLPESQKTAIILRRYEELSYEQIAEVMNLSGPAVKSLLSRARVNLKKALAAYIQP